MAPTIRTRPYFEPVWDPQSTATSAASTVLETMTAAAGTTRQPHQFGDLNPGTATICIWQISNGFMVSINDDHIKQLYPQIDGTPHRTRLDVSGLIYARTLPEATELLIRYYGKAALKLNETQEDLFEGASANV